MTTIGVAGVMTRIPDGQYTSTVYGMIRDGKYQVRPPAPLQRRRLSIAAV